MSIMVLFLSVLASVVGWWLSRQRLASKPWLEEGDVSAFPETCALPYSPVTIGLGLFLAVIGSLFALLISAYSMRMELSDWRPLPIPGLLWFNTAALVLASCALSFSQVAIHRNDADGVKVALVAGGFFTCIFLVGQVAAWSQLSEEGYTLSANPASTFFYLITGLHGLHVFGGVVALGRTLDRTWRSPEAEGTSLSITLCAVYWHFLLLTWLVLLSVMTGWANEIIDICRGLFP